MKSNTFKNSQDFRKSLEVRLQRTAKEKGIDLQRIRRQVAFDRLLARFFTQSETPFFLKVAMQWSCGFRLLVQQKTSI